MRSIGLLFQSLLVAQVCLTRAAPADNTTSSNSTSKLYALSSDTEFDFQLQAVIGLANGGGSNTGEVLRAASQIVPGDEESFYAAFKYLADAIHEQAMSAAAGGFNISARDAYFRASAYYRAADFFLHHNRSDPRLDMLWDAQLADFAAAIRLLPVPGEKIAVAAVAPNNSARYDIPVYFYPAVAAGGTKALGRLPTVLVGTGFDGAQEDLYHQICARVAERGYNCATYEGPGQPTVVHQQRWLGFTPQWERVVDPVADALLARGDVDPARLALVGVSFGGQLAPLALARTPRKGRFAAALLVDGIYSLFDSIFAQLPSVMQTELASGNASAFDAVTAYVFANNLGGTSFDWAFDQGLWAFNTSSYADWLGQLRQFDVSRAVLQSAQLTGTGSGVVPVFVGAGQSDTQAPGQAAVVWQMLTNGTGATNPQSQYHLFTDALGAGLHCQLGADAQLAQATMGWLAGVFGAVSKHTGTDA
ncbi:hypothetical protein SEUCBS139899_002151 [Sporothrix eucalyptigena]